MGVRSKALCAVAFVSAATPARAYAGGTDSAPSTAPIATRIDLSAALGLAGFHRSTSQPNTEGGGAVALDVHVHPSSEHGFFAGYADAAGVFGPTVSIVNGGYSWRFAGERRIGGKTGAGYLDFGPAVGVVSQVSPNHVVVGGHVALTFDAYLGNVSLGFSAAYQGGVPTTAGVPDSFEGAVLALLRIGAVFDVR